MYKRQYLHQQLVDEIELLDGAAEEFDLDKVLRGELSPVFFGSALTNFGVEPFLAVSYTHLDVYKRQALHSKVCKSLEEGRMAALVMLKDHDLPGGVQGRIQILQKQLFRTGIGVEGKVHHRGFVALQKAPRRHDAGGLFQRKVPSGACTSADQRCV